MNPVRGLDMGLIRALDNAGEYLRYARHHGLYDDHRIYPAEPVPASVARDILAIERAIGRLLAFDRKRRGR